MCIYPNLALGNYVSLSDQKIKVRAVFSKMSISLCLCFRIAWVTFSVDLGLPSTESRTHTSDSLSSDRGSINLQRLLR